jgi:receptor protein-tyrosine kinase
MSLIEQAAKRLEELRRAGAELPKDPPSSDSGGGETSPTPEAFVRVLNARAAESAQASAGQTYAAESGRPLHEPPTKDTHALTRSIEIDFSRLGARGFITPDSPKSQIADEFRVIKRPILRNALDGAGRGTRSRNLIMVTSALPQEGKTFTAVNLALSMATEVDKTVLLIDGDVAHPTFTELLGVPREPGLLDLLTRDDLDVADALVKTNIEKLTVLSAGLTQRFATELLASEQMASLLRVLAARYPERIIIFDSPPLLATTEARVLASHMGQIIMVVAADATTQHAVGQALAMVESCDIVMMMLNKASDTDVGRYYGYYGYHEDDGRRG